MIEILINGAVAIVSALAGSWGGWFFARKKYNSEVDSNVIKNMQDSLDFYEKLSDDNKQRLDKVLETNKALSTEMDNLSTENRELRESVALLTKENKELKKSIGELKSQINTLTTSLKETTSKTNRIADKLNSNTNEKSKSRKTVRKPTSSK